MEDIKRRAKCLKEIMHKKNLTSNMELLFPKDGLPDFILECYLKIGILNVEEDIITRRWDTMVITYFEEDSKKVYKWAETMHIHLLGGMTHCINPDDSVIMEDEIDIEGTYIKHLEVLTDL